MKFKDSSYLPAYYNEVEYIIQTDFPYSVGKVLRFKDTDEAEKFLSIKRNYKYARVESDYNIFIIEAGTMEDNVSLTDDEVMFILFDMCNFYYSKVMQKKLNKYEVNKKRN